MITIVKTITEYAVGLIKDPAYATGYKRVSSRREGSTVVRDYEEAPAPRTYVYGEPDAPEVGIVRTEITGCEPGTYALTAEEVRLLLETYTRRYAETVARLNGTVFSGYPERSTSDLLADLVAALAGAARFGVDLTQTNVAL